MLAEERNLCHGSLTSGDHHIAVHELCNQEREKKKQIATLFQNLPTEAD
jgi:hypothetical protein